MRRFFLTLILALVLVFIFKLAIWPKVQPRVETMRSLWTVQKIIGQDDATAAEILSSHYVDPDFQNPQGDSLLIWALSRNMPDTAKILMDKGADPNLTDSDGIYPLMHAASFCSLTTVRRLVKKGAVLNALDKKGRNVLFYAVQNNGNEILSWFLKKGLDPNVPDKRGETPLHTAIKWHSMGSVDLLLQYGADIMAQDDEGNSPLTLMEISPLYNQYIQRKSVETSLPDNYLDTLPVEDLTPLKQPFFDIDVLQMMVHKKVNQARVEHGLPAYKYAKDMESLAQIHSKDMAERDYFEHYTPEGLSPADRAEKYGISLKTIRDGMVQTGIAENLYMCSLKQSVAYYLENGVKKQTIHWHSADTITTAIVEGWLNSPGHRRNLLAKHLQDEGIGIAISKDLKLYASQEMR